MQTATADLLVGRSLEGRYRILDRIARGGMSTVYAAVDERLERMVAVKVMTSALSNDPAFSDRFAREARAAARLTHLNAVSVFDQGHDVGPDGHHVFLVMELVEGRTVRDLLTERGRLTPAEAVSIMEPVLSALSAAHRAGLVHHDVKPENILLSDEGVVKVADFGLARAIETDPAHGRTGLMMGTVAYAAPEQISRGNADPRSDVYSAGIVLFELLTGAPPYSGDSPMNIAWQHVHSRVPAPSSRVRDVPTELDEIVVAATDSDPSGRPSDAGAFLAEIADARIQLGLPVTPVPARSRAARDSYRDSYRDHLDHRTAQHPPEHATTDMMGQRRVRHDTMIDPGSDQGRNGARPARAGRDDNSPPPPVVIPPRTRHRRRRTVIAWLLVVLLGLASFFGARAIIAWRFGHIPEVGGNTETQAESSLKDAGYRVKINPGRVYSETVASGRVVSTDPDGGTRLATGKTVTITLSNGRQTYRVPNVAKKSPDAARAQLIALGKVHVADQVRTEYSDTIAANEVTRTSPKAGSRVSSDDTITIWVSKGLPTENIPSVVTGTSLDAVKDSLENSAGRFKTRVEEQFSDNVDTGLVISISPTGRAQKFSTIVIYVSKGPQNVPVPDIAVGASPGDAEEVIRSAGLNPQIASIGTATDGSVVAIRPLAGTIRPVGSTVTIYVLGR